MTSDAGYIILPPLAAALYKAVGRAPLAGLAAVFAGVAAGFNANLAITSLEPMLSELATKGAQVIDPSYEVNPACNWWFMIASTIVMTLAGWFVADVIVEKRLANKPPEEGGPSPVDDSDLEAQRLTPDDKRALKIAGIVFTLARDRHHAGEHSRFTAVHLPDRVSDQTRADGHRRGGRGSSG